MIKVKIKKPMIEEELLVEDIRNLGLPPIIVTRVLEEFASSTFDAKKAQDIVGRLYKEQTRYNVDFLSTTIDQILDEIESSAGDIGGLPTEFTQKFYKIVKLNVMDKKKEGRISVLNFKEMKGLEKSLKKAAKTSLSGELQEDALQAIEARFNERYLKQFASLFQNSAGGMILNYLKKHPTNWKEIAKLDFNEAMDYVNQVSLTQENDDDIVHKYKDGYYWINLGEGACELEGKRMGHCGRDDRGNLVSLRTRPKGSKASKSHVTLSYNEYEDTLYQIKGRENNAPEPQYWPYIKDFIERFGVDEVKEDGEHSNDDFQPLLEFIAENTNASVDTERAELESLADDINNGQEDTEYLSFNAEFDDYNFQEASVRLDVNVQFKVEIPDIPADAVIDEAEILEILQDDDFLVQISDVSYMGDFIEDPMNVTVNAAVKEHGELVTFHLQIDFDAYDQDYSYATTREDLQQAVNHYKYNFGEDDIEGFRTDIKEIAVEFMKPYLETEGKGKIADILEKIEDIEADYKHFYADYDLEDPTEPIEFVLSSRLPVQIEAFSFEVPRELRNTSMNRQYQSLISAGLSNYNEAMKNVFRADTIHKMIDDSIKKINRQAYSTALKQTRLDFPGYNLGEEDIQQYRYMGSNFLDNLQMRYPSPLDLSQKKTESLPSFGFKANTTIKWLDDVEDIDFMMRWVATIDGLWPQILEDMKPKLEDLNLKLKAEKKKLVNSMMKRAKEYADQLGIQLQENKRNIKLILKK